MLKEWVIGKFRIVIVKAVVGFLLLLFEDVFIFNPKGFVTSGSFELHQHLKDYIYLSDQKPTHIFISQVGMKNRHIHAKESSS